MNILFFDDDLKRHHLFTTWLRNARAQKKRSGLLNVLRRQSQRAEAPPLEAHSAFTVEEGVKVLRASERFDIAFLDHDLDGRTFVEEREGTGTEVAEFIATMQPTEQPRRIILHSHNPAGARRMAEVLNGSGCSVETWAFGSEEFMRCINEL